VPQAGIVCSEHRGAPDVFGPRPGVAVSLERLNRWLTLGANLGVLAGIVFLAMEIHQNNEMAELQRSATAQARVTSLTDMVIADPALIGLLQADPDTLEASQLARLELLGMRLLMSFEESYFETQAVLGDSEAMVRVFRAIYHRPELNYGAPLAWETYRLRADPDFLRWFEREVIQAGPPGS